MALQLRNHQLFLRAVIQYSCVSLPLPHSTVYRPQTINTPPSILYTHTKKKNYIKSNYEITKASKKELKHHKFIFITTRSTIYTYHQIQ